MKSFNQTLRAFSALLYLSPVLVLKLKFDGVLDLYGDILRVPYEV